MRQFGGDDRMAHTLLDLVLFERRCCAHLTYELLFEPDHEFCRKLWIS